MATFGRRRGRPPHPDVLTPSERRVLELIRLGKTNAEIANELAISIAGVKYHVTNMLGKLRVGDRTALAAWGEGPPDGDESARSVRRGLPALAGWGWLKVATGVAGVVAVGALAVVALSAGGSGDEPGSPGVMFEIPAGYARMTAADLEALGMVDAGLILRAKSGDDAVLAVQMREALSPLYLRAEAGVVEGPGTEFAFNFVAVAPNAVYLTGEADGMPIDVTLWSQARGLADGTNIVIDDDRTRRIVFQGAAAAQLLLAVTDSTARQPLRAAIATNGHLFVDPDPLPRSMVVDQWTGSALDVAGTFEGHALGPIGQGLFRFTGCEAEAGLCSVSFRAFEPLIAPFAGELRCIDRENAEVDAGEFILHIERVGTGYGGSADFDCEPHAVVAGDVIGDAGKHWSITAYRPSGEQISAGVSFDGRFFVGQFGPTVGCPCVTGN